jgi:hypothetical protein
VQERAAELVGDPATALLVDVDQHDLVAAAGQLARDLGAEAGGAAGDQGDTCRPGLIKRRPSQRSRNTGREAGAWTPACRPGWLGSTSPSPPLGESLSSFAIAEVVRGRRRRRTAGACCA